MRVRDLSLCLQRLPLSIGLVRIPDSVRHIHLTGLLGCSLLVSGCASTVSQDLPSADESQVLIARDFAQVLAQVPSLVPAQNTLSMSMRPGNADFGKALLTELFRVGYAVRHRESSSSAENHLEYRVQPQDASSVIDQEEPPLPQQLSDTSTYLLSVNAIGLRRMYAQRADGTVQPSSAMQARGFDASLLTIDDSIFKPDEKGKIEPDAESIIASKGGDSAVESQRNTLASESNHQKNGSLAYPTSAAVAGISVARGVPVPDFADTTNYRELGMSNYARLLEEYAKVDNDRFLFPNDSSDLGQAERALIERIVGNYQSQTDIVLIVGSSHGKAPHDRAQENLARARALAVRDEVVQSGVPENRILLEASWSANYYDRVMPRRGAVVSLWRTAP